MQNNRLKLLKRDLKSLTGKNKNSFGMKPMEELSHQIEARMDNEGEYMAQLTRSAITINPLITELNGLLTDTRIISKLNLLKSRLKTLKELKSQRPDAMDFTTATLRIHHQVEDTIRAAEETIRSAEEKIKGPSPKRTRMFGGVGMSRLIARNPRLNVPDPDDVVDWDPLPPDDDRPVPLYRRFYNPPVILETGPERRQRLEALRRRQELVLQDINRREQEFRDRERFINNREKNRSPRPVTRTRH
jgi:hypothetical protein